MSTRLLLRQWWPRRMPTVARTFSPKRMDTSQSRAHRSREAKRDPARWMTLRPVCAVFGRSLISRSSTTISIVWRTPVFSIRLGHPRKVNLPKDSKVCLLNEVSANVLRCGPRSRFCVLKSLRISSMCWPVNIVFAFWACGRSRFRHRRPYLRFRYLLILLRRPAKSLYAVQTDVLLSIAVRSVLVKLSPRTTGCSVCPQVVWISHLWASVRAPPREHTLFSS
mmetsp:Transcript_5231/g.15983  ORF Transcript_5231/g.15983 Transcript_5231/m.15983 type:complete len:223 (+) Transcript_5231:880-1548(+)